MREDEDLPPSYMDILQCAGRDRRASTGMSGGTFDAVVVKDTLLRDITASAELRLQSAKKLSFTERRAEIA
eukprot:gene52746-24391_t